MTIEEIHDYTSLKGRSVEEQEQIELILLEADGWGLRFEVESFAKKFLNQGDTDDPVLAACWAYEDWVK